MVEVPDDNSLDVSASESLTVATWVRRTGNSQFNNWSVLVSKKNVAAANTAGFNLALASNSDCAAASSSDSQICWLLGDGTTDMTIVTTGSAVTADSLWHHVVAVLDRKDLNNSGIYVDGVKQESIITGSLATLGSLSNTTNLCLAGAASNCQTNTLYHFNGTMDETRIYKRALSPQEIAALYNWAPGPVGYWKMDENSGSGTNDASGNSNTCTFSSMPASPWRSGKVGAALDFQKTDDVVTCGSGSSLDDLHTQSGISVSAWIYPRVSTSWEIIAAKSSSAAPDNGWIFQSNMSNRSLEFWAAGNTPGADVIRAANNVLTFNQWQYVTATWTGGILANNVKLYVKGVEVAYTTTTTNGLAPIDSDAAQNLTIGNDTGLADDFDGFIDEVKIYNYARTPKQIVEDMNGGHPAGGSPVGSQVAYWKMNEGYGTTINNSVASTNITGSITGAAWRNEGKFGKALDFDGVDDVVTVTNTTTIDFDNNLASGSAISAWIYPDSDGEGDLGLVYSKGAARTLRIRNESGGVASLEGFLDLEGTTDAVATASGAITIGGWNHVIMQYADDADDEIELYVNGRLRATSSGGAGRPTSGTLGDIANLLIGNNSGGTNTFDGKIDEVKIYSSSLTQQEILIDYNENSSQKFGSLSTTSNDPTGSSSAAAEYCVPGDTSTCTGPVGRWDLEEGIDQTAYDTSTNGNNGTLGSTSSPESIDPVWTTGKVGKALDFSTSRSTTVVTGVTTDPSAFTVSAWVFLGRNIPSGQAAIVSKANVAFTNGFFLGIDTNGTAIYGEVINGGSATFTNSPSTPTPLRNQWVHYTLTYDGTNLTLYQNGIQVATGTGAMGASGSSPLHIGSNAGNNKYFDGKIDQVWYYNYARTPAQVAWDYNRGGPIGHWKMNECSGTSLYDSSGNNHTATISIGPLGSQSSVGDCNTASTARYTGRSGKLNYALSFDGNDDTATFTESSSNHVKISGSFTTACWIKFTNNSSQLENIISKANTGSTVNYALLVDESSGIPEIQCDRSKASGYQSVITSGLGLAQGVWYHVACSWNSATGVMTIYVNGKPRASGTDATASLSPTNGILYIGGENSSWSTVGFNGLIDDVRIYSYDLTLPQMKQLYNGGAAVRFAPITGAP